MNLISPPDWSRFATKDDVGPLRNDVDGLRDEIRELGTQVEVLGSNLRAEFHDVMRRHTMALGGLMVTLTGIAWATVTFGG